MRRLTLLVLVLLPAGLAHAQGRGRRDVWERVSAWDADKDGKVSRKEFQGPARFFDRLDADGDGFVTKAEAGKRASRRGRGNRDGAPMVDRVSKAMDTDKDGKVSKAEWDAFFSKADRNGDGVLQHEELMAALGGRRMVDNAPKVGTPVPRVAAKHAQDGRDVDLGAPKRVTVLVFGSWT